MTVSFLLPDIDIKLALKLCKHLPWNRICKTWKTRLADWAVAISSSVVEVGGGSGMVVILLCCSYRV